MTAGFRRVLLSAAASAIALSVACGGSADPTPTPTSAPTATPKPSPTPAPLLTLREAQEIAQRYAATDIDAFRQVSARYPETLVDADVSILCISGEDRYSPERETWVIHCAFLDKAGFAAGATAVAVQLTAIADEIQTTLMPLPQEIRDRMRAFLEKTYLVDDATGQIRQ